MNGTCNLYLLARVSFFSLPNECWTTQTETDLICFGIFVDFVCIQHFTEWWELCWDFYSFVLFISSPILHNVVSSLVALNFDRTNLSSPPCISHFLSKHVCRLIRIIIRFSGAEWKAKRKSVLQVEWEKQFQVLLLSSQLTTWNN